MARSRKEIRTGKKRRPKQAAAGEESTYDLPGIGPVPLVEDPKNPGGLTFDPDFEPQLPAGAVRGDIRRQVTGYGLPSYFFVDAERVCVQCGDDFVFGAAEQKFWFESLQFNRHSTAIRCPLCRRKRRTLRAIKTRYDNAVGFEFVNDSGALLEFAAAACELVAAGGGGDAARVVAAARRARRADSSVAESWFWEGRGHELAGRSSVAVFAYREFIDRASTSKQARRLVQSARRREQELGRTGVTPPERGARDSDSEKRSDRDEPGNTTRTSHEPTKC